MGIKRVLNLSGFILLITGIIFILNYSEITGFVILENIGKTTGSIIGTAFIIGGILLLTASRGWNNYRVGLVIREYESGELNPVQAALKINDRLFPEGLKITGVDYRGGVKETIKTEEEFIPVSLKDNEKAKDLALALYEMALINSRTNAKNCELHLGKQASSKHHKEGLTRIIKSFEHKYQGDLEMARG